jgi:hypothetical protein
MVPAPRSRSRAGRASCRIGGTAFAAVLSCATAACAGSDDAGDGAAACVAPVYRSDAATEVVDLDASCPVALATVPLLPALHVAIPCTIEWNSNPPSSGPHYPIWAAYQAYSAPVPRGYYVHDLEHGAIVFLYNCGDAGCPDVVAALTAAAAAIPDDPLCEAAGQGVRVRAVVTPDPLLDVPVAAAAWGFTYKAQCPDLPTLIQFATAHYGQGPESFCTNGTTVF